MSGLWREGIGKQVEWELKYAEYFSRWSIMRRTLKYKLWLLDWKKSMVDSYVAGEGWETNKEKVSHKGWSR